jgi:DNA recombination protein RmuC
VVICFVPGEAILATALSDDPGLYEHALSRKVVLASPGTLFAVLRTVGAIWQQEALEQNARELLAIGQDLYARLGTLGGHVTTMGQSLARSVEHYNKFVGTLESRVLVTARRMHELHLVTERPPALVPLEAGPRALSAAELLDDLGDDLGEELGDELGHAAGPGSRDAAYLAREAERPTQPPLSAAGDASA